MWKPIETIEEATVTKALFSDGEIVTIGYKDGIHWTGENGDMFGATELAFNPTKWMECPDA